MTDASLAAMTQGSLRDGDWSRRGLFGLGAGLAGTLSLPVQATAPAAAATLAPARLSSVPLVLAYEAIVKLGPVEQVGNTPHGKRVRIPITGGRFAGPRISGTILPEGMDCQLIRTDGVTEIEASYLMRETDGTLIQITNCGIASKSYIRSTPVFEAPARQASVAERRRLLRCHQRCRSGRRRCGTHHRLSNVVIGNRSMTSPRRPRRPTLAPLLAGFILTGLALGGCTMTPNRGLARIAHAQQGCSALAMNTAAWSDPTMNIVSAVPHAAGLVADIGFGMKTSPLPAHCELTGILHERTGQDGQPYAIRFHMRLPDDWNGRFLFQGGGGTNGDVGSAIGLFAPSQPPALIQGYAIISQDSGHSNSINGDPARGGAVSFGFDAQARRDYGHSSLKVTYDAARAILLRHYGSEPVHSYFAGCSKGGQEGMAFAQRYPDAFDGILAAAPGFALPKAALAEAWDTQTYAALVRTAGERYVPIRRLASAFSDADLMIARQAVLAACDAKDGLVDGLVAAFAQCTNAVVLPVLRARVCILGKSPDCLASAQVDALVRGYGGPRNSRGELLYANFPWDAGMADIGWRIWKLGTAPGGPTPAMPAINAAMGAPALASIFSTPPRLLGPTPQDGMNDQIAFDFDSGPAAIHATAPDFPRSGWEDIGMRSSNLSRFRAHGGKMIVPHGVSDPVFSLNDTLAWWADVDRGTAERAQSFVRVFPVPGMGHCNGGPATDQFDAFTALVGWVEKGIAPDRIVATAGPATPWPGRSRPLCPYPLIARPLPGATNTEEAAAFVCTR